MVEAGEWPKPSLLEAILEQGDAAIAPLRAVLGLDMKSWTDGVIALHAANVLTTLGASIAIIDLIKLFLRLDENQLESLGKALAQLGDEAVAPLLAVGKQDSLTTIRRAEAVSAARLAVEGNPAGAKTVAKAIRDLLADRIAKTPAGQQDELSGYLIGELLILQDPEARSLIGSAFDRNIVPEALVAREDIEDAYHEEPIPRKAPPKDWLRKYKLEYTEQFDRAFAAAELKRILQSEPDELEEFASSIDVTGTTPKKPKPGRNDPCWCGSGKKYKSCHLAEDAGMSRN